ncbi:hypothetical protein KKC47_02290, partial [Patescibacteria group bacterium]|nr:hypothetical protein [Patescibacteria group bacterium]
MSEENAETETKAETQTTVQEAKQSFIKQYSKTIQFAGALISLLAWIGYSLLMTGNIEPWWDLLCAGLLGFGFTSLICTTYRFSAPLLKHAIVVMIFFTVLGLLLPSFRLTLVVIFICAVAAGIYYAYGSACRVKSLPTADYHLKRGRQLLPSLTLSLWLLGVVQGLMADGPAVALLYAICSF